MAADFTPVVALNDRKKLQTFSIIPHFNHDFKHYTNGFCTGYEGVYARKQFARYKEKLKAAVKSISADSIVNIMGFRKCQSRGRKVDASAGSVSTASKTTSKYSPINAAHAEQSARDEAAPQFL